MHLNDGSEPESQLESALKSSSSHAEKQNYEQQCSIFVFPIKMLWEQWGTMWFSARGQMSPCQLFYLQSSAVSAGLQPSTASALRPHAVVTSLICTENGIRAVIPVTAFDFKHMDF